MIQNLLIGGAVLLAGGALYMSTQAPSLQEDKVEDIIKAYILENPEILPEAIENLRVKQTRERVASLGDTLYDETGGVLIGPKNASVTIVEFYDYQCGFCRRALGDIERILAADSDVNVLFRQFPIRDREGETFSFDSSLAALAAKRQDGGDFLSFHKSLYGSPTRLTAERILTLAEEAGYDQAQLEKDMADPLLAEAISVNRELATALGLRGTPGYVIGGKIIPGAEGFEALMAAVEEARKTA